MQSNLNTRENDILILKGNDIHRLLEGQEAAIIDTVSRAYCTHSLGESSLPHSIFLRFPNDQKNRIIALPAYLGGEFDMAGIKWVSSFPENTARGFDRASAVVILNSPHTGRPQAILEGSLISAKRTAASAALAARELHHRRDETRAGIIGCGVINHEIVRFLRNVFPNLRELAVYDMDPVRAERFASKCRDEFAPIRVNVVAGPEAVFDSCTLVSFATTALQPHILRLPESDRECTILHISLRDISPELILSSDNVVDDPDHVSRAQTSIHLAEQMTGNREFIRCTLADIILNRAPAKKKAHGRTIFSPFGLGVLDLAVGKLACDLARAQGSGTTIDSFLPDSVVY